MQFMAVVQEYMAATEAWVLALGASPWLLLAVFLLSAIDGFFPPVPSESVVISVAVLAVAGDLPTYYVWLLMLSAAAGAFLGDLIAWHIGARIPVDRMRIFRGPRGQRGLARAKRALARRGTLFILSGRFVPVGRVAVNMTAGAVHYPRVRFAPVAAVAAVVWAGFGVAMGTGAGHLLQDHPLIAVVVGIGGGVLIGLGVDKLLGRIFRRWFPDLPDPAEEMDVELDTAETREPVNAG